MRIKLSAALVGAFCFTAAAQADVEPVGTFLGDGWESFELVDNPGTYPSIPMFEGDATMTNPFAGLTILAWNLTNFPNNVELGAYNGNYFAGAPVGQVRLDFDMPIRAIGAYLGTAGPGFPTDDPALLGTAELFNGATSLGTVDLEVPIGDWAWHGWHSEDQFTSIVFTIGGFPPGEAIMLDDVVYSLTTVPEPAAAGLLGLLGLGLLRRRRPHNGRPRAAAAPGAVTPTVKPRLGHVAGFAAAAMLVSAACAVPIYAPNSLDPNNPGSTGSDVLIMFDSANPSGWSVVGSMGVDNIGFGGMDFDASGNLWAYASFYKSTGGAASGLYSIDTSTGLATPVGGPPRRFLDDIAFNPANGKMYGLKTQNNATYLWTINLNDGELTYAGEVSGLQDRHNVNGLAFSSEGDLFLLDNRNNSLYGGSGLSVSLLYQLPVDEGVGQLVGSQGITIDWSRGDLGYHGAVGQGVFPDYFSNLNTFALDGSLYSWGDSFGPNVGGLPPVQPGDLAILPSPDFIIPEPAAGALLVMSAPLFLRRRRA